jgi:SAM-dependent methyltransferase
MVLIAQVGVAMRQLSNCLVCGGTDFKEYAASTFGGGAREAPEFFLAHRTQVAHGRIVTCASCGFRFTNPQFEPGEYDQIYEAAGSKGSNIPVETADMRRFHRLAGFVRDDAGSGRFLDFGCGRGGFLSAMDDPSGVGFEVGPEGAHQAGRSTILTGRFFDLLGQKPFLKGGFDFITAFDVFEHLPDLDRYVGALGGLLKTGGRLIVTVPDVGSWMATVSGRRWNMYLLEHLWFFDEKTLAAFMARLGFRRTQSRKVPYDASLGHIARRLAHTYSAKAAAFAPRLPEVILPVPAGVMYGVFERTAAAAEDK